MRVASFASLFALAAALSGTNAMILRARDEPKLECGVTGDAPLSACRALDLDNINTSNTCDIGIGGNKHNVLSCAHLDGAEGGGPNDCCVYSTVNNWRPEILKDIVGKILDGCGAPDNADKPGGTVNGRYYDEGGERICIGNGDGW
ncbi:hypothetical protein OC846_006657 [Tilletia horrida]|uniref:Hydrophobin n=1 Tax=Tilletia horrida TaxID=155126 RepID=A0AAN6JQE5_9BASI|nr:hypothetical protein OC846_006657 [Tilletia horrida]